MVACVPLGVPTLPPTIAEMFYKALKHELPDALAFKQNGAYKLFSSSEVQEMVELTALGLHSCGLKAGERLAIMSENRTAWAIMDYACAVSGIVSVPIYHALAADQAVHLLKDSECRFLCLSSATLLKKILEHREKIPTLDHIILFDENRSGSEPRNDGKENPSVISLKQLMQAGKDREHERPLVRQWAGERQGSDLLTILYTSGTTGDPKGAMLTQGNLASNVLATVEAEADSLEPRKGDRVLSVLPLSHIFERMAGHYTMFYLGVAIYYAESLLSLPSNMLEVRPNILAAVPRIFEKIYSKVHDTASSGGFLSHWVYTWALGACHRVVRHLYLDRRPPWHLRLPWKLADRLVLSKVREKTGGQLRFAISGGAPLNPNVMEFFWAMGLPIYEGYGLTETSPVIAVSRRGKVKPGFVGSPLLKTWQGKPFLKFAPDGELLCQGPNVMSGYWKNETATRDAFDRDGYFRTGDIGSIDPQGRVQITDRKKEIIVTSGGKKVAPQPIENLLMSDPYIEQAMLIGDQQEHLAAIIVPHFNALRGWCKKNKLNCESTEKMINHEKVLAFYKSRVEKANKTLSNFERIWRFLLSDQEMSVENGQLTPSLKVKRRVVLAAYQQKIEALFKG